MNFIHKIKKARESYIIVTLVLIIVMMGNYISSGRFQRVDLTQNQLYAISDSSKNIMQNLEDIVTVKVFFSEKLPPNLFAIKQYVQDILDELSSYSKGNLSIQFLNPSLPEVKSEALKLEIPQVQMNIVEKDKLEVKNGFLGVAIQYGEKTEILPIVQNILNIEYDLVASIKKVTAHNERVIGVLAGYGEPKMEETLKVNKDIETLSLLKQALDRNYTIKNINLGNPDNLKEVDTLLMIGTKNRFIESEKEVVQEFIESGGNLVLMTDPQVVSGDLQIQRNSFNANELIGKYGISHSENLILDRSNENASFNQGFMSFVLPYPLWVKAVQKNFHPSNPIVSNLESAIFPWSSPINISKENSKTIELIKSTGNAWLNDYPFQLEPNLIQNSKDKNQYLMSAITKPTDQSGYLFTTANSRFITDRFVQMYPQNLSFAMNAIDFITLDQSLINIRSKNVYENSLKELNIRERQMVKLMGTFLMPFLVIVFGITRFFTRRRMLNNIKW